MSIQTGDRIPESTLTTMGEKGPVPLSTEELFGGKKVVLVSVPGAFTPTCSARHLPGFVDLADKILAEGVDTIAFFAVNDVFVMNAWGKDQGAGDKVLMVADGDADFAKATGLELDLTGKGLGLRNQRFAMVVEDGVVKALMVDPGGKFETTGADSVLKAL